MYFNNKNNESLILHVNHALLGFYLSQSFFIALIEALKENILAMHFLRKQLENEF